MEEAWNRMFENTWPNTREALLNAVNSNLGINRIKAIKREELLRFMIAMEWRTFPPNPQLLEKLNKIPLDALNEPLDEEEKYLPTINTYGEHVLHDLNLKFFKKYFKNDGPIHEQFDKINEEMDVELLVPETGYEFITSDNPIKIFENANKELEYIFAITPNLACAIRKNNKNQDKNKYWLTTYPKEKVFDFNKNVKEASYRGYILKQPNLGVYFK
nr:DUF4238 domain-containing protein [Planococcus glaciei]